MVSVLKKDKPVRFDPLRHLDRLESTGRYRRQPPELIVPYLPRHNVGTLVELGCGTGFFGRALARFHPARYIGLDPSEDLLKKFVESIDKKERGGITLIRTEREQIPLKTGSVGLMVMANVLHEIMKDRKILPEIGRVLSPAAFILIVDWKKCPSLVGPPVFLKISRGKAVDVFGGLGFKPMPIPPVYRQHYCLILKRTAGGNR